MTDIDLSLEVALSVRQPWAWLIALSVKDIENRTRRMPEKYVGESIYLHACKTPRFDKYEAERRAIERSRLKSMEAKEWAIPSNKNALARSTGALIARVTFGPSVQDHKSPWADPGAWHWPILSVEILPEARPMKGALGFWKVKEAAK